MLRTVCLLFLCALGLTACATSSAGMNQKKDETASSLAHIRQKMAGEEHFTIVALGDSVTEVNWTTRGHLNWVGLLSASLFESGYAKR